MFLYCILSATGGGFCDRIGPQSVKKVHTFPSTRVTKGYRGRGGDISARIIELGQ
jgi:hypothetical protein